MPGMLLARILGTGANGLPAVGSVHLGVPDSPLPGEGMLEKSFNLNEPHSWKIEGP